MAGRVIFRVQSREFTETLRKYQELSRRDPATIANTKAFYIARRAVIETPKASAQAIRDFIGQNDGAIAGKIINQRRAARGEVGLYGKAMQKAVSAMRAARLRSVAFLKSGWLPAIKALEPLAEKRGAPRAERGIKQIGQAKGFAKVAKDNVFTVKAIIANLVQAKWDKGGAEKRGLNALQKAFDAETASMKTYIEKKMRQTAHSAGIKTN